MGTLGPSILAFVERGCPLSGQVSLCNNYLEYPSQVIKISYLLFCVRTSQDPIWYGILNSSYSRLKPQLLLSLTLEIEEVQSSQAKDHTDEAAKPSSLTLTLDPSSGFYQLGSASVAEQEMFTLSLTLQNVKKLPPVSISQFRLQISSLIFGDQGVIQSGRRGRGGVAMIMGACPAS